MSERVSGPTDDCPKCGETRAFLYVKPTYVMVVRPLRGEAGTDERLDWACIQCGYCVSTPTVDALGSGL